MASQPDAGEVLNGQPGVRLPAPGRAPETSQIPFTPVTAEALSRLTPAEQQTFTMAAELAAAGRKPSMMTIVTLVETVHRLITEPVSQPADGDLGRIAYEAESRWLDEFIPGGHQTPWEALDPEVRDVYRRIAGTVAAADREQAGAKLAAIREYRAMVDEDGEQVILIGPCADGVGCLFHRNYDSPTLGQMIDAATEHEGEQGERAHAHVAEMAADWDEYAAKRNAELAGTEGDDPKPCSRCEGCGQLADTDDREPWTAWTSLPPESQVAVRLGIVRPVPCDACGGTGRG